MATSYSLCHRRLGIVEFRGLVRNDERTDFQHNIGRNRACVDAHRQRPVINPVTNEHEPVHRITLLGPSSPYHDAHTHTCTRLEPTLPFAILLYCHLLFYCCHHFRFGQRAWFSRSFHTHTHTHTRANPNLQSIPTTAAAHRTVHQNRTD